MCGNCGLCSGNVEEELRRDKAIKRCESVDNTQKELKNEERSTSTADMLPLTKEKKSNGDWCQVEEEL